MQNNSVDTLLNTVLIENSSTHEQLACHRQLIALWIIEEGPVAISPHDLGLGAEDGQDGL